MDVVRIRSDEKIQRRKRQVMRLSEAWAREYKSDIRAIRPFVAPVYKSYRDKTGDGRGGRSNVRPWLH